MLQLARNRNELQPAMNPSLRQIACYGNPEPFIINPNLSNHKRHQQAQTAIKICQQCAMLTRCREWVLRHDNDPCPAMVVAAMTPQQRQQHRTQPTRRHQPTIRNQCGTPAGYERHRRQLETPCPLCRQAANQKQQQYRQQKGTDR